MFKILNETDFRWFSEIFSTFSLKEFANFIKVEIDSIMFSNQAMVLKLHFTQSLKN